MRKVTLEYSSEILEFATKLLKKKFLVTTDELEQEVYKKFHSKFTSTHFERMPNRRRTRWQNLVDWCKAHWTRTNKTVYVDLQGKRYIAWIPLSGVVHNITVHDGNDVLALLQAIEAKSSVNRESTASI